MKKHENLYILIILLLASSLPVLVGNAVSNSSSIYTGVVFNPMDGYTYLAKMEIGNSGDWLFKLPFTAFPGEGRLLYPFYILVGQFLRISGLSLSMGFNIFRLLAYGCLVISLIKLVKTLFPENEPTRGLYVFLMAAGGGLGWLLLPFGKFGADFWVSEAYPFLAGLANPHFPLSIALMVFSIRIISQRTNGLRWSAIGFMAIFLSVLSPFGFVLMSVVLVSAWLWEKKDGLKTSLKPVVLFIFCGLPYSIYQYWAVGSTPQLAAWTAQNQTPSPEIWDVLLSFSPWIILVGVGWRFLYQKRNEPVVRHLIVWLIMGLVFTIIPFNLQRRFMIGLSIPVTSLGLMVLPEVAASIQISTKKLLLFCTAGVIPTTLLLIIMVCLSIGNRSPLYFIGENEKLAINWLSHQGNGNSLVLASDQIGLVIPSVSRLRVLYGHPFETVNALKEKQDITDFFTGKMENGKAKDYIQKKGIDWIYYGPRERALGNPSVIQGIKPVMEFGNVLIFNMAEIPF
jgi:hypothetical protein